MKLFGEKKWKPDDRRKKRKKQNVQQAEALSLTDERKKKKKKNSTSTNKHQHDGIVMNKNFKSTTMMWQIALNYYTPVRRQLVAPTATVTTRRPVYYIIFTVRR
jgi:hypothetical protein